MDAKNKMVQNGIVKSFTEAKRLIQFGIVYDDFASIVCPNQKVNGKLHIMTNAANHKET